jgi:hypothetical protein
MPWWQISKKKEDDEVSHPYRPRKALKSSSERSSEPKRRARPATELKEPKHNPYLPSSLRDSSDSDEGPSGSMPAVSLLKTSRERAQRDEYEPRAKSTNRERAQRVRDEYEPRAKSTIRERAQRARDEYEPVAKSTTRQHQPRQTLRSTLPGQSQRTRIVVGIDFGTTCVAWCCMTVRTSR